MGRMMNWLVRTLWCGKKCKKVHKERATATSTTVVKRLRINECQEIRYMYEIYLVCNTKRKKKRHKMTQRSFCVCMCMCREREGRVGEIEVERGQGLLFDVHQTALPIERGGS